ncbi:DUF4920 domain-containing protein [Chitinophaga solisilvae]|uniref:DUF4920 domain-containing protein n=1 Tax=Chitinophaga solisilvae TaxID=1233460 RepID=A0A433WPR4_9BACT|nr:DUF4920 domain-containing protein [Chitinophaga solisilvae]NSL88289.1 DUF4920 domain-containing protein [Chitinophaga solisilvae]
MKRILFLLLLISGIAAKAQPPKGTAAKGTVYGAGANANGAIEAVQLPTLLKSDTAKMQVKVKAKVLDVCPKKGCWMKLQVNDSTTAFVKMKNYGFFVPLDIKGKTIVLDGLAYNHITSVAELQHYAEDAKKSPEEINAITQPKKEIRFTADGIVVVE